MFDQVRNQPKKKCTKCKKLVPDTGLCSVWSVVLDKAKIKKSTICEKCFYTEKEKMIIE